LKLEPEGSANQIALLTQAAILNFGLRPIS